MQHPASPSKVHLLLKSPRFIIGFTVTAFYFVIAVLAPMISPQQPEDTNFMLRLCLPNAEHFLGCDSHGADVLSIMIYGARTSLYVGFLTVGLALSVGVFIGLISGYYGRWVDNLFMRIVDVFMAFPGILLAMCLAALMGPSLNTVIFSIAATGWTSAARLIRAQVMSLREREYVLAAAASGASAIRLMFKHILPMTLSPLIVHATFSLSGVIIIEAGLSYLGLGAQDGTLTWGGLLGQGSEIQLDQAPHITLVPGFAIFSLVVALNFIGDALRDTFDPKQSNA